MFLSSNEEGGFQIRRLLHIWYIYIYDIWLTCIQLQYFTIFHLPEAQQTTRNQSSKGMPPKSGPQKSTQTFCCSGKSSAGHLTNSHLYEQNWWFQPSQKSANQFNSSVPTKWNIIENINPGTLEESPCFKWISAMSPSLKKDPPPRAWAFGRPNRK